MSISRTAMSFYSESVISSEIPVFDPELQRLIEELDHLDTTVTIDSLPHGDPYQGASFDPFAFASDDESYLSLYDLCGGDPALVDDVKGVYSGSSIGHSTTTPPLAATPSPMNDDFGFPAPTVGGKWAPSFHPGLAPPSLRDTPIALPPAALVAVPHPQAPATPDPTPASRSAGPSRAHRTAGNIRTQPYRKAAPVSCKARRSGKHKGRIGRTETRDYLAAYPARVEDITPLQGYRGLIRAGHWSPIIADALTQIGVPYPMVALQRLLSELYDGEGEQEGIPKGAEGRPAYPWRVSLKRFLSSSTASDDTDI